MTKKQSREFGAFNSHVFRAFILCSIGASLAVAAVANAQVPSLNGIKVGLYKGHPSEDFLSAGGLAAVYGPADPNTPQPGYHDNGRGGNSYANDPCLDPPAPARERTVQSETELAVLNATGSMGKKIVVGYNDSWGFYDRSQGLSGYAYSVNGGNTFVDGGGLPPLIPGNEPAGTSGVDAYFGDPVIIVHHKTQRFFYFSIYKLPDDSFSISMNRGTFQIAPPTTAESMANTTCLNGKRPYGTPDTKNLPSERIVWEPPIVILQPNTLTNQDFLDKEWAYVDQTTGTMYVTYTRFTPSGQTPLELMRCLGCANLATVSQANWDGPYTIVPNEVDTFNQATMPITTPFSVIPGPYRVVASWIAQQFNVITGAETDERVEYAYSDTDGMTWTSELFIADVNPQGEPNGYNRGRASILNAPYNNPDKGQDDGVFTSSETSRTGFGNVYVTYFSGQTPVASGPPYAKAANIYVSTLTGNATVVGLPVKVNDDPGTTSHVFPTVQVNKNGYVYGNWLDRRNDPVANVLTDAWANVSKNNGATFGPDRVQTDVATSWFVRADARPNFGDYNSSDLLGFNQFVITFADGRFPPPAPAPQAATPDTMFTIANGLGQ
ncbi:MAG: hypothetical protein ABR514_02495 [Chthoniobacterales bacterium]